MSWGPAGRLPLVHPVARADHLEGLPGPSTPESIHMKISNWTSLAGVATAGALAAAALAAQGPQMAEVGAEANYAFSQPLLNGKGLRSLQELRGKPVLIEFWGTR